MTLKAGSPYTAYCKAQAMELRALRREIVHLGAEHVLLKKAGVMFGTQSPRNGAR